MLKLWTCESDLMTQKNFENQTFPASLNQTHMSVGVLLRGKQTEQ